MYRKNFLAALIMTVISTGAFAQTQAIGIRAGDPLGVTYKMYSQTRKAIEFIIGTASPGWHPAYYENSFYAYNKYNGYNYLSHRVESTIYLQARYLLHYDIPVQNMEGKLQWYWGVGAMLKAAKVQYTYSDGPLVNNIRSDVRADIDLGPEGIGGLEYDFESLPLTVFGETSLLFELVDRPATLRLFGAVGIRVKF